MSKEANYLLAVKANHKGLLSQIDGVLLPEITRQASEGIFFNEADYQKSREEFRCCAVSHNVSDLSGTSHWEGAKTVGVIVSYRKEKGKISNELCYRYYISSAPVFAGLRHIAFNQLKAETSFSKGMPAK